MCHYMGTTTSWCACRGGKSSIQKVVFHKLSPNETLFLESTSKVVKDDISNSSFVQFQVRPVSHCIHRMVFMVLLLLQIWDFPGQIDFFDPTFDSEHIFGGSGALIFVIDAQASCCQPSILIGHLTTLSFSRMTIGRL